MQIQSLSPAARAYFSCAGSTIDDPSGTYVWNGYYVGSGPIEDYEDSLYCEPKTDPYRIMKAQRVRKIVAGLPVKMKEAVVLRYFHDLSEYEISEVIGCPVGTVKSRLYRAAEIIRKKWELSEG